MCSSDLRAAGRIIDFLANILVGGVAGGVGGVVLALAGGTYADSTAIYSTLAGFLGSLLMSSLSEALGGATIGKWILGYRVVSVTPLGRCGIGAALIRNLGYYIDALFFGLVAYYTMGNNPLQQRLGDKWGGTAVIAASALPPEAHSPGSRVALGVAIAAGVTGFVQTLAIVLPNL